MISQPAIRVDTSNDKLAKSCEKLQALVAALNKKDIPAGIAATINEDIRAIDQSTGSPEALSKSIDDTYGSILKLVEKDLGYVPRNHYRRLWLPVGMAAFGIPFGVLFSLLLGNFAYIGLGMSLGLPIGLAIGTAKDKKAEAGNKTLDID